MRKWSSMKTWEKQLFLKRAAIVCAALLALSLLAVFVIKPMLTPGPRESLFPDRNIQGYDYPSGRRFKVIAESVDGYKLSGEGTHNAYLTVHRVRYDDGEETEREFPVLWYEGRNCFFELLCPEQLVWLDRGEKDPRDFALLFAMQGDDRSLIFCTVTFTGDVYDSSGNLLAQFRRNGLVYSYFSAFDVDLGSYRLYINGMDRAGFLKQRDADYNLSGTELTELFQKHAKAS